MNIVQKNLKKIAKALLGKGVIDKFFPYLYPFFEKIYILTVKDKTTVVKIPNGKLKVKTKDTSISLSLLLKKEYEPKETELILKILKKGYVFLDIGANIGYYTVLASKAVGAGGRVFAFEPDKDNFSLLKENLKLNHCQNVTVVNKAVADKNGKISFKSEKFKKGESKISPTGKTTIRTLSLDSFLKGRVNVVKIDIEGAEILALKGAKKTLSSKNLNLFIEYNPRGLKKFTKNPYDLIEEIEKLGFKIVHIIDESRKQVLPFSKTNLEYLMSRVTYCNLYCES